jgi:hypothetical protein
MGIKSYDILRKRDSGFLKSKKDKNVKEINNK